jgi:hypothetical protein
MRYFAPLFALLLLGAAAVSEPAAAQPNRARQGVQSGEVRSLDQILNGIRRERPGSLADVEGPNIGPTGEPHYRLKWLTPDGRVLWLDTDARTGRVLGVQGDDRGPGPRARPVPPGAQGQTGVRRNFGTPPGQYQPRGAPTGRVRPPPGQGYRTPPNRRFGSPPPTELRRVPAPPRQFDRGGPTPQRFNRGPTRNRSDFNGGGPSRPRTGFSRGGSFGGGGIMDRGRGQPRGPRRVR